MGHTTAVMQNRPSAAVLALQEEAVVLQVRQLMGTQLNEAVCCLHNKNGVQLACK